MPRTVRPLASTASGPACVRRKQATGARTRRDEAGIADEFLHDELSENAPSRTASSLDQLVDDGEARKDGDPCLGGERADLRHLLQPVQRGPSPAMLGPFPKHPSPAA